MCDYSLTPHGPPSSHLPTLGHNLPLSLSRREYAPIAELDAYGSEGVDDEEYEAITAEQRARAEKEISRREKQEALASGRLRPGLLYGRLRQTDGH